MLYLNHLILLYGKNEGLKNEALDIFEKTNVSTIGIVDMYGHLLGLVTLSDITKKYIDINADYRN